MISLIEIKSIIRLEGLVKEVCPQNETWNWIVDFEKEMSDASTETVFAYEIMDSTQFVGIMQYCFKEAGLFRKEKLVISLLSLIEYSEDWIRQLHSYLIEKHGLSGELIHVIQLDEEGTAIHNQLKIDGFEEKRSSGIRINYGYEEGSLYFIKNVG